MPLHDNDGLPDGELKNDIDMFYKVFGKESLILNVIGEQVFIMLELGIDKVIGKDTMMAWGFDAKKKVYARLKTSIHYRDVRCEKVIVQEGTESEAKFAPQFQLESIINNYVSQTWSHGSKPFINPVDRDETEVVTKKQMKKALQIQIIEIQVNLKKFISMMI